MLLCKWAHFLHCLVLPLPLSGQGPCLCSENLLEELGLRKEKPLGLIQRNQEADPVSGSLLDNDFATCPSLAFSAWYVAHVLHNAV